MRMHPRRKGVLALVGAATLLAVAGVAYATIPDSGGVYTACRLNSVGTIRLIDPSASSSSLLSHCTALETRITWNAQGQKGDTGAPGKDGVSPTVTQLAPGDSNCPAGGAEITDAAGTKAYVCSGQHGTDGKDGQSFTGAFTSPNKEFSLSVADDGVEITGPDATISLPSSGGVAIKSDGNVSIQGNNVDTVANNESTTVHGNRTESVGQDETIFVGRDRSATVGRDETITVHGNRTETVDSDQTLTVHGNRTETVDNNENITIGGNHSRTVGKDETVQVGGSRTETVGKDESVTVGASRTETVGGDLSLRADGSLNLRGSLVMINDGSGTTCQHVARVGDTVNVNSSVGVIVTGSATVCVGGP
jgi:hypothetical protein